MRLLKTAVRLCGVSLLLFACSSSLLAKTPEGKELIVGLGLGDQIAYSAAQDRLVTLERLRKQFQKYKTQGADIVIFRIDPFRWLDDADWPDPKLLPAYRNAPPLVLKYDELQWQGIHDLAKLNVIAAVVQMAHENGLKIVCYSTTFDEGMLFNEVWYRKGERAMNDPATGKPFYYPGDMTSVMITKFVEAHPECVMVDRTGKKHSWGTIEFAYPEARTYCVEYNRRYLDQYAFDGIWIDFRNEFAHPAEFGDEFGFSQPIVDEYHKRYGVDILHEDFDIEKWRRMWGEYLTQYIRELHAMTHAKGKTLVVGLGQGNYMGPPTGNLYVDWQRWANEHIVDGLFVGMITGKFLFPESIGYGYVNDMEAGIGLPNFLTDLQNNYAPVCARNHVKLYVNPRVRIKGERIPVADYLKTNIDGLLDVPPKK